MELIKVQKQTIGAEEINAVDARELWQFLGSKQQFSNWISMRIEQYNFVQAVDFITKSNTAFSPPRKDYTLSMDMAKELSMVERNEKGKEARQYFIEIQNKAEKIIESLEVIDYSGNINDLVFSKDGIGYTNSRVIAEKFQKKHKNILQTINNLLDQKQHSDKINCFNGLNFQPVEYIDKKQEVRNAYEITEQGFSLIALSFTGEKALEFKIDFINAFFQMKEALIKRIKVEALKDILPERIYQRQFVYIISNDDNDYIKIGVSKNVNKRLKQLQTGSWTKLTLLYKSIICSNAFNIESIIHTKLKQYKVQGEWFDTSLNQVIDLLEQEKYVLKSTFIKEYYKSSKTNIKMEFEES